MVKPPTELKEHLLSPWSEPLCLIKGQRGLGPRPCPLWLVSLADIRGGLNWQRSTQRWDSLNLRQLSTPEGRAQPGATECEEQGGGPDNSNHTVALEKLKSGKQSREFFDTVRHSIISSPALTLGKAELAPLPTPG